LDIEYDILKTNCFDNSSIILLVAEIDKFSWYANYLGHDMPNESVSIGVISRCCSVLICHFNLFRVEASFFHIPYLNYPLLYFLAQNSKRLIPWEIERDTKDFQLHCIAMLILAFGSNDWFGSIYYLWPMIVSK